MPGKVVRVADGLTDKGSARAKKILPAGALLSHWAIVGKNPSRSHLNNLIFTE